MTDRDTFGDDVTDEAGYAGIVVDAGRAIVPFRHFPTPTMTSVADA